MSTASNVLSLTGIEADLNYNTVQLSFISKKYEATHKKLEKMVRYEEKWQSAFEDAQDVDKTINACGFKKEKGESFSDQKADQYAHAKVKEYDEELLLELTEEDMEYDAIKTVLEASITELQAQKESLKQATSTSAQDTHLLQS